MGNAVWKILGTGSAILAGLLASKLITLIWAQSGRDTDFDPRDPDTPLAEALTYTALVGLTVALARTFATRKAAQVYQRSSGHLPRELRKDLA